MKKFVLLFSMLLIGLITQAQVMIDKEAIKIEVIQSLDSGTVWQFEKQELPSVEISSAVFYPALPTCYMFAWSGIQTTPAIASYNGDGIWAARCPEDYSDGVDNEWFWFTGYSSWVAYNP